VALQLERWLTTPHRKTLYLLQSMYKGLENGQILWHFFLTHQLLAYADDINILGENIHTIQNNTKALLDASKEVGLEVNSKRTKYMLMSHKKAGQKHGIKIANMSFEDVAKFKYLVTTLTDQNCMQEEINLYPTKDPYAGLLNSIQCLSYEVPIRWASRTPVLLCIFQ
jgi:hypothetical protein